MVTQSNPYVAYIKRGCAPVLSMGAHGVLGQARTSFDKQMAYHLYSYEGSSSPVRIMGVHGVLVQVRYFLNKSAGTHIHHNIKGGPRSGSGTSIYIAAQQLRIPETLQRLMLHSNAYGYWQKNMAHGSSIRNDYDLCSLVSSASQFNAHHQRAIETWNRPLLFSSRAINRYCDNNRGQAFERRFLYDRTVDRGIGRKTNKYSGPCSMVSSGDADNFNHGTLVCFLLNNWLPRSTGYSYPVAQSLLDKIREGKPESTLMLFSNIVVTLSCSCNWYVYMAGFLFIGFCLWLHFCGNTTFYTHTRCRRKHKGYRPHCHRSTPLRDFDRAVWVCSSAIQTSNRRFGPKTWHSASVFRIGATALLKKPNRSPAQEDKHKHDTQSRVPMFKWQVISILLVLFIQGGVSIAALNVLSNNVNSRQGSWKSS